MVKIQHYRDENESSDSYVDSVIFYHRNRNSLSTFSIVVLFELDYLEITYFTLQRSFDHIFLILARRLKIGHGLKLKLHHLIFSKIKTQKCTTKNPAESRNPQTKTGRFKSGWSRPVLGQEK